MRLHQPSAYYGVNSRALGNNTIDQVGWNQGLNELAPVGEVCAYFDAVMQQQQVGRFCLPSGDGAEGNTAQRQPQCASTAAASGDKKITPLRDATV